MKCECCNKNRSVQNCYMCIKSICKQCQIINTLNYRNRGVGGDWGTCKECYEQWVYGMEMHNVRVGKTLNYLIFLIAMMMTMMTHNPNTNIMLTFANQWRTELKCCALYLCLDLII